MIATAPYRCIYLSLKFLSKKENYNNFLLYCNIYNVPTCIIVFIIWYEFAKFIAHAQVFIACVTNSKDEQRSL